MGIRSNKKNPLDLSGYFFKNNTLSLILEVRPEDLIKKLANSTCQKTSGFNLIQPTVHWLANRGRAKTGSPRVSRPVVPPKKAPSAPSVKGGLIHTTEFTGRWSMTWKNRRVFLKMVVRHHGDHMLSSNIQYV